MTEGPAFLYEAFSDSGGFCGVYGYKMYHYGVLYWRPAEDKYQSGIGLYLLAILTTAILALMVDGQECGGWFSSNLTSSAAILILRHSKEVKTRGL